MRILLTVLLLGVSRCVVSGGVADETGSPAAVWKDVAGTKIPVPPGEHPRLYLRAGDVERLAPRLEDPSLQPVVNELRRLAKRSPQYDVEWRAVQYLVHPNRAEGLAIVAKTLEQLRATKLSTKHDACRATGRMMVTGAIVYDWLYDLLTDEQKQAFIDELIRLAKTQECGYPPTKQGSITGHASEAMILRDMISAGIAIYDEQPELYDRVATRIFSKHVPARNWAYAAHAHHQGTWYGPYRFSWDAVALWIFDRMGAGNIFNPEQRFVPYYWFYATRPDRQRLRAGDTSVLIPRGEPWPEGLSTLLIASYYGDGYLLGQYLRQDGRLDDDSLFALLWRDTSLAPLPPDDLPRSRYFPAPMGWMIARTGWDDDAVLAEMKVNVYNFNNHQHMDAGAFQLYYRGALAIDSGLYYGSSGLYGSPHCRNYYWRTIAHNSLLVHDPDEKPEKDGYENDGGQRMPNNRREVRTLDMLLDPANGYRTGEVLAHGFGPDAARPAYTLLAGDITAAYSQKVRQAHRSFVFLNLGDAQTPAALVVFDRLVATKTAHRKYWLLHTQEEPRIEGTTAVADCTQHGDRGRLVLDALLPASENLDMNKVGGPGKEFWCFGINYPNSPPAKKPLPTNPDATEQTMQKLADRMPQASIEPGAWRVELSPKRPSDVDLFLNVMQVTDRQSPGRMAVERINAGERVGCRIQGRDAFWCVLFCRDAEISDDTFTLVTDGLGQGHYLVTGLAPGRWTAQRDSHADVQTLEAGNDSHAIWFEGPVGTWTISRRAANE